MMELGQVLECRFLEGEVRLGRGMRGLAHGGACVECALVLLPQRKAAR